jgi:hypothetical protein
MEDLCGLLGGGSLADNDYSSAGIGGNQALYVRGSQLCRQDIGPVSSGSTLPIEGDVINVRSRNDGSVHMPSIKAGSIGLFPGLLLNRLHSKVIWHCQ